jgi:hypothetical protein
MAYVRLITKLKIQSEFTHTAYLGGENAGGWVTAKGIVEWDALMRARSRCAFSRYNAGEFWKLGLKSGSVTVSSPATAAENKAVYGVPVYGCSGMNTDTRTHENEDYIGISSPALGHLVVVFFCDHREERSKGWLISPRRGLVLVIIYYKWV